MEPERESIEKHSAELRSELKIWEKAFQDAHEGRKPGRDDVKANPAIAAKYKAYNKTRDQLSGKIPIQSSPKKQKRAREESSIPDSPSKRPRSSHETPRKSRTVQSQLPDENAATAQETPPKPKPTHISPTPHKNGLMLGIFHSLYAQTPSRNRDALSELPANVACTPSRRIDKIEESPQFEERARPSRTPVSAGKRFLLDSFVTPRKKKADEQGTPSASRGLATPAFLRRDTFIMSTIDEEPRISQQPWKKRSFGRTLSGMIQDMKKQKEEEEAEQRAREREQEDEEMDLMREMEDGPAAAPVKPKPKAVDRIDSQDALVLDSQAPVVLDQDGFVPSDIERDASEEEQEGVQPRKPWKKKGLKRQTRRVNMRPVAKKVQEQPAVTAEDEEVVPEAQLPEDDVPSDIEGGSDDDYANGNGDEDDDFGKKTKKTAPKSKPKAGTKKSADKVEKAPAKPKATRKTKPDAHANYRALKIKNKNSKGKGGGRFGRRR